MYRPSFLFLSAASLALVGVWASDAAEGERDLFGGIGISYSNGDKEASLSFASGCWNIGGDHGKVGIIACLDRQAATALNTAQPQKAYAQVTGIFEKSKQPTCKITWEIMDEAVFKTLSANPPTISVQTVGTFSDKETQTFDFLLPIASNPGSTALSGSTGAMTTCTLVGLTPAAAATTTTTPATTTTTTTPAVIVDPPVEDVDAAATATTTTTTTTSPDAAAVDKEVVAPDVEATSPAGSLHPSEWATLATFFVSALTMAYIF